MVITATELKKNLGKYLDMCQKETIMITKNGKVIAELSNPAFSAIANIRGLLKNKLPNDFSDDDLADMKIEDYESIDRH